MVLKMSNFWPFPQKVRRNRSASSWSMSGRSKSPKIISTEDLAASQLLGAALFGSSFQSDSKTGNQSLQWTRAIVSKPAPYWEGTAIVRGSMKEIKLTDYRGKYLVLVFYPLAFTYVCPTEILSFSDQISKFHAIGAEVVACSVDSLHSKLAWLASPRNEGGLGGQINIALLSDLNHKICKEYGVLIEDGGHSLRGLFIVDEKGVLRHISINDLQVGRSVNEVLRLVQAFQHVDKHGDVCPADWIPGAETIVPDPKERLKYFRSISKDTNSIEKS